MTSPASAQLFHDVARLAGYLREGGAAIRHMMDRQVTGKVIVTARSLGDFVIPRYEVAVAGWGGAAACQVG